MTTSTKICSPKEALALRRIWQLLDQTVVFTNGCFDILHLGHVDYLEKARNLGDKLIVGINTDLSVQRLKGSSRPVAPLESRARVIASLQFVDCVVAFEEDTPKQLIELLAPDILTKGSDYTVETIVGADFVLSHGGKVETLDLVDGFSTSTIIQTIIEKNNNP